MDQTLLRILKNLLKEFNADDFLYALGDIFQSRADECIEAEEMRSALVWQRKADAVHLAARTRGKN